MTRHLYTKQRYEVHLQVNSMNNVIIRSHLSDTKIIYIQMMLTIYIFFGCFTNFYVLKWKEDVATLKRKASNNINDSGRHKTCSHDHENK